MRLGVHTIIWGAQPDNLLGALDYCVEAGFTGVEFFQHPSVLRRVFGSPGRFRSELNARKLAVIGLCSGTLIERLKFCEEGCIKPDYFYADERDEEVANVMQAGYTVAFHPHVYRYPQIDYVFDTILPEQCEFRWILDPAHFAVVGKDPTSYLEKYYSRLVSIHLKDWGPWYGRSYHRYAQGFRELGKGRVNLLQIIALIRQRVPAFGGWAVIEQDAKTSTPERSIADSIEWLLRNGIGTNTLRVPNIPNRPRVSALPSVPVRSPALAIVDSILRAQETPEIFPDVVVQAVANEEIMATGLVTLWALNPLQQSLSLVASHPKEPNIRWLPIDEAMCGRAVRTKSIQILDPIPDSLEGRDLRRNYGVRCMVSVPIGNRFNPNDVEFVLNLFLKQRPHPDLMVYLPVLSEYIAQAAERIIADRCTRATGAVRELYVVCSTRQEFLDRCLPVIAESIHSVGTTIFLKSPYANRLLPAATTGIKWFVEESKRFYSDDGNARTSRQWIDNGEYISANASPRKNHFPLSQESVPDTARFSSTAFIPIRDYHGNAIGIVRCQNKISPRFPDGACFSQVDITVMQAICDAIYPRLALFESEERVFRVFQRITHELKTPVVAINSDLDFIEDDCSRAKVSFREPYIHEARAVTELMEVLIENAEITLQHLDPDLPEERPQHLHLMGEVVAPLVDQMSALLRRYRLPRRSISYREGRWSEIPKLWICPGAIRQVLFNLISNAIKYRHRDSLNFSVEISPRISSNGQNAETYHIDIDDWGPGISYEDSKIIFEWGKRGKNANRTDVNGSGFGLAISRQIMEEHGGSLELTKRHLPTRFTITFPANVAVRPWTNARRTSPSSQKHT